MKNQQNYFSINSCSCEESKIISALLSSETPLTRRQISNVTDIEISVLARITHQMVYDKKLVNIRNYGSCGNTFRKMMHFSLSINVLKFTSNFLDAESKPLVLKEFQKVSKRI